MCCYLRETTLVYMANSLKWTDIIHYIIYRNSVVPSTYLVRLVRQQHSIRKIAFTKILYTAIWHMKAKDLD